jgi:hypothetical protein
MRRAGWATLVMGWMVWLVSVGNAAAETKTWVGGSGGNWHADGNWNPVGVPTATDDAVIASSAPLISTGDAAIGSVAISAGLSIAGRTLTVGTTAPSTIAAGVTLSDGTLRLNGGTTWSDGTVQITNAGAVESAGTLQVTGAVAVVSGGGPGQRVLRTLTGGVAAVSGALSVGVEIENDGTLRALPGGTLTQSAAVASPADSSGVFDAQGSGMLSFSSVLMGSASSATGTGTIRFAGGTSQVAAGAGYAAGITEVDAATLDFDDDGTTVALRIAGDGTRRGDGTLTVGNGQSSLGLSNLSDAGVTAFSGDSHTAITDIIDFLTGGHALRLNGTTTWSAGTIQIQAAGTVENAGSLLATGNVGITTFSSGRKLFRTLPGGVTEVSGALAVGSELENDGILRALDGGILTQVGSVPSPPESSGTFDAQGAGVLSFSNVLMGAGSTATGSGTIRFAGGTSTVAAGASYAAGITEVNAGTLDFDDDGTTVALRMLGDGTRRGDGTLTVGAGQSSLGLGNFSDAGTTAFTGDSQTTITDIVDFFDSGHTLRLNGNTTWSAGTIQIQSAGTVENAGQMLASGNVGITTFSSGRKLFRTLPGGVTEVSGALTVGSELENDGILRAREGGLLTQVGGVPSPADSGGSFDAQGTGVLSLSNVLMGTGSSATGSGTIRFAGGTSTVAAGAGYAAGITEVNAGTLDFDDDGTTVALRMLGDGTRSGNGTLTVGAGQSSLGLSNFADAGVTAFTGGSQTTITDIIDFFASGHTLRLNGNTTWSAGTIQIQSAGTVENAGFLLATGNVAITTFSSGRKLLRTSPTGVTAVSGALSVASEIENDGTLRALDGGTLTQVGGVVTPADSSGTFNALGTGVLSLSNVLMGAGSSATGDGTIRFAGGTSTVAAGAGYAAGITEVNGGTLDFDDDGTTVALRMAGDGTRRGDGTLTVGAGESSLGLGNFSDAGTTAFTADSRTTITNVIDFFDSGHTLRLNGTTNWSAGTIQLQAASTVENAGVLQITGPAAVATFGVGQKQFRNVGGSLLVSVGQSLSLGALPLQLTGGAVGGDGTINATVSNTGGTLTGTLTIDGDYTQASGGTLRAEIGIPHDRLDVTGTATLAGALQLVTKNGFDPGPAAAFRILEAATRTGTFATVSGTQATPQKSYAVDYDPTGVTLTIGLGPANTAPPSIPASGEIGQSITCQPGNWTGAPTYAYSWLRDGTPIAAGQAYTLNVADAGRSITCRVTATNANGSGQADSNALTLPVPPTPTPTPTPTPPQPDFRDDEPPPPPTTGKTVNVAPERGTVTIKLPDGRTVPLDDTTQIVTGSVIDTRKGAVRLESTGAGGKLEGGVFSEGLFKVTQTKGAKPITELALVEPLSCPKGKRANAAAAKKKKRRLWGDAKGNFRTRGRYGSAVNTGTKWMVEDRCDRTLFKVERGTILASKNGSRKTVRVRAGRTYTIRG